MQGFRGAGGKKQRAVLSTLGAGSRCFTTAVAARGTWGTPALPPGIAASSSASARSQRRCPHPQLQEHPSETLVFSPLSPTFTRQARGDKHPFQKKQGEKQQKGNPRRATSVSEVCVYGSSFFGCPDPSRTAVHVIIILNMIESSKAY